MPRRYPSSSEISCIARTFGAPETVPAGKHARRRSNGVTPSRSSPATSETRCVTWEKRSGSSIRSTRTVPGRQTRPRSLRPRSTSITCSARSFSDASSRSASPGPGSVVPAIGFTEARRPSIFGRVAGEDLCDAGGVVEAQEQVGDEEAALRQAGALVGQRYRRLELRDVVVGEVPHDRLVERLRLIRVHESRAAADERVPPEAAPPDRLHQEGPARPGPAAQ